MYGRSMPFVWPIDGIGQSMYGPTMTFGWSIDVIGIAGATLTTLCWLPQALKVIREKERARYRCRRPQRSQQASVFGSSMDLPSRTGRLSAQTR